jgi:2-oxo-4-hydroxy-4-carboxy-5-ureidoimidazoline decarboxylase
MRELPRQLSAAELVELFEARTALVEQLDGIDDPLEHAEDVLLALPYDDKVEALNAHPPIGKTKGLSTRSALEQGSDTDPAVLAELAYLNQVYEEKFGFRFVVFVAGRPRSEILEVLRERIARTQDEELETGCRELVAIARNRWIHT